MKSRGGSCLGRLMVLVLVAATAMTAEGKAGVGADAAGDADTTTTADAPEPDMLDQDRVDRAEAELARIACEMEGGAPVEVGEVHRAALAEATRLALRCQAYLEVDQAAAAGVAFLAAREQLATIPAAVVPGLQPEYKRVREQIDRLALRLLTAKGLQPEAVDDDFAVDAASGDEAVPAPTTDVDADTDTGTGPEDETEASVNDDPLSTGR